MLSDGFKRFEYIIPMISNGSRSFTTLSDTFDLVSDMCLPFGDQDFITNQSILQMSEAETLLEMEIIIQFSWWYSCVCRNGSSAGCGERHSTACDGAVGPRPTAFPEIKRLDAQDIEVLQEVFLSSHFPRTLPRDVSP